MLFEDQRKVRVAGTQWMRSKRKQVWPLEEPLTPAELGVSEETRSCRAGGGESRRRAGEQVEAPGEVATGRTAQSSPQGVGAYSVPPWTQRTLV